jgi:hypothetical protein
MSTGDYDDIIADNIKDITAEISSYKEGKTDRDIKLDRRLKDLNIAMIGVNRQLADLNKNLVCISKVLAFNTDRVMSNKKENLEIVNNEIKDFLEILRK